MNPPTMNSNAMNPPTMNPPTMNPPTMNMPPISMPTISLPTMNQTAKTITIYALQCEHDKWYIGRTDRFIPNERILEHFSGNGSQWTKLHMPLRIDHIWENADIFDEDKYAKMYIGKYGIENVRGGSYVQLILSSAQLETLQKELSTAHTLCFHCNMAGHWVKNCPYRNVDMKHEKAQKLINKDAKCARCRRHGHSIGECYAKTDISGNILRNDKKEQKAKEDEREKSSQIALTSGTFYAQLRFRNGLFLNLDCDGHVRANTEKQLWLVNFIRPSHITLYSSNGRYLCAEKYLWVTGDVIANATDPHSWEEWYFEQKGDSFALKSYHDQYLSTSASGEVSCVNNISLNPNELFTFIRSSN